VGTKAVHRLVHPVTVCKNFSGQIKMYFQVGTVDNQNDPARLSRNRAECASNDYLGFESVSLK
jgi:hypothetical protein